MVSGLSTIGSSCNKENLIGWLFMRVYSLNKSNKHVVLSDVRVDEGWRRLIERGENDSENKENLIGWLFMRVYNLNKSSKHVVLSDVRVDEGWQRQD